MVNARKAVESTYTGSCTVSEYRSVKNEKTKITRQQEVVIAENVPCRLSFESKTATVPSETVSSVAQGVRLFIAPEITVKSGSKITVMQNGVTTEYSASGMPAVYNSHQEIMLELFRGWA